jgi:Fur family transcriptional regulator, peroxide stress response regulator
MDVKLIGERQFSVYADRRLASFATRCRKSGLAVTPQRLAIIRVLLASPEHPTAEVVYKIVRQEHPHISLATVHRTLDTFCEIGEASKVTCLHDSARYDGNLAKHDHLICIRCQRIRDIEVQGKPPSTLGARAMIGDFLVLGTSLEILAVCGECRRKEAVRTGRCSARTPTSST